MFRRIKQFIQGLFARATKEDYTFLADYLSEGEKQLFLKMSRVDQRHSLNMAYSFLDKVQSGESEGKNRKILMIRAALLHDIGKSNTPELTLWRRSVCVLLEKFFPKRAVKWANKDGGKLRRALYIYFYHPQIGAKMLERLGVNDQLVKLVRWHHDGTKERQSRLLKELREVDNIR